MAAKCLTWMSRPRGAPALRLSACLPVQSRKESGTFIHTAIGVRSAHVERIKVLYGSQTGTATSFAMQLSEAATAKGVRAEVTDLYEYTAKSLADEKDPVVFIVSCFGRGEPTDSAKKFFAWLATARPEDLKNLKYTVFGLGSSGTHKEYYNVVGRMLDKRLEELGSARLFPRGEGDDNACIEMDFETWQASFLDSIAAPEIPVSPVTAAPAVGDNATTSDQVPKPNHPVAASLNAYHSEGAPLSLIPGDSPCDVVSGLQSQLTQCKYSPVGYTALPVTALSNLTPGEERPVFELHLDNRQGLQYATGDHVAVLPQNPTERVAALCARMGWSPDLSFGVEPSKNEAGGAKPPFVGTRSVGEVLASITDLQAAISPNMLRVVATHATNSSDRDSLLALSDKSVFMSDVRAKYLTFLDLLKTFPSVRMPFDRFLSTCPLITPRYYSVSSSSKMFGGTQEAPPSELHITFRHVRNVLAPTNIFQGLNTTYMATRRLGDDVHVAIRPSEFRMPADPATQVIMLGGGIGIAPFKAFLEERIYERSAEDRVSYGKSLMLYGCRDENDQIMLSLMKSAVRIGALTSFDVGYAVPQSRSARARMADALVLDHSKEIWEALQQGGKVYVCGGAKGFGQAVANSVRKIAENQGGMTGEQSAEYLSALLRKCQYVEDLAD